MSFDQFKSKFDFDNFASANIKSAFGCTTTASDETVLNRLPAVRVRFSAKKWKVMVDDCMDQLKFAHDDSPDDIICIGRRGDEVRELKEIMRAEKQYNVTQEQAMERLIWLLIKKGILFHPIEELN